MTATKQRLVADLIREIRSRQGLTQEKFAARLGVTCLTVNRWENGRAKPSPLAMEKIEAQLREMGVQGKVITKAFES